MIQGEVNFVEACQDFFGGPSRIVMELRHLNLEEREKLREELIALGYKIYPLWTFPQPPK